MSKYWKATLGRTAAILLVCYAIVFSQNTSRYHAFPPNSIAASNSTSAIASAQVFPKTGSFTQDVTLRVSANLTCFTQVASATATMTISWTDPGSTARTIVINIDCTTITAAAAQADTTRTVRLKNGTSMSAQVAIVGAIHYDASLLVEQIN